MKVVVLAGPESSGKSSLAAVIQARFGGVLVGEYVREFIQQQQRDTCYADIPAIARGQLALEDAARRSGPPLLILDTNLLSNLLWSRTLFGDCPPWVEAELRARHYDLYLLLDPREVAWVDDGQRCQPRLEQRQAFHAACHHWLSANQQTFSGVSGNWPHRQTQVLRQINDWLKKTD
jgi:NadR type nicotinamide-nucleotide adenylyltransferase